MIENRKVNWFWLASKVPIYKSHAVNYLQWCRNRGGQGGHWPPQYLVDQLTLFQPGRGDFPHLLLLAPPMFFTFRHHWFSISATYNRLCDLSQFCPKKLLFKANMYSFLTFMSINFLVWMLQCNVQKL